MGNGNVGVASKREAAEGCDCGGGGNATDELVDR